jgi:hypothetical protein
MAAESPPYFPGRDYPDREVWLKRRYTPQLRSRPCFVIHVSLMPTDRKDKIKGRTLRLGVNAAKRYLVDNRTPLLKQRREYYHSRNSEQDHAHV